MLSLRGSAPGCPPASPGSPLARPRTWGAVHPEGLGPGRNGVAGCRVEHILGRFLWKVVACGRTGAEGVLGGQDPPAEPGRAGASGMTPNIAGAGPWGPHTGRGGGTEMGGRCAECKGGIGVGQGPSKAQVSAGPGGQGSPGVSSSEGKSPRLPGMCSLPPRLQLDSGSGSGSGSAPAPAQLWVQWLLLGWAGPLSLTGARGHRGLGVVAPQDGEGGAEVLASPQYLGVHTVARPRGAVLGQEQGGPAEAVGRRPQLGGRVLHEACGRGL